MQVRRVPHVPTGTWPGDGPDAGRGMRGLSRRFFAGTAAVLGAVLCVPILTGALVDCWRDENYSHGVLVPFLVAWLVRARLREAPALEAAASRAWERVAWLALAAGGLGLVLGGAAAEQFVQRVAALLVLLGLAGVLAGPRVFRAALPAAPLALCMVPLPYIVYYRLTFPLQLLAARLAAGTLALLGQDVTRDGNIFVVGGHALEVVRACSGIRSIMALVALALASGVWLRAALGRAALLAALAVPAALAGNVLRLVTTSLLVTTFGAHMAEGHVHEAVGVASFLASLALLGLSLRIVPRRPAPRSAPGAMLQPAAVPAAACAVALLAACGALAALLHGGGVAPPAAARLDRVPVDFGDYAGAEVPMDDRVLEQVRADDHVFRTFATPAGPDLALYLGYYKNPRQGAQIHSPQHCYPGAGWKIRSAEAIALRDLGGALSPAQRLVVEKRGRQDVVVYWYETRSGRLAGDFALKLDLMRAALRRAPQDAAFVRWSTEIEPGETLDQATRRLLRAVADTTPDVEDALPFRRASSA